MAATETMSPREKVARVIAAEMCRQDYEPEMTPDKVQFGAGEGFHWSYIDQGEFDFGQCADAILAALASSGDHAELARAIDRLLPITIQNTPDYAEVSFGECQAQAMTMEPETWLALNQLPSLIAEVAALRGERDQIAGESIWWKGVIGDGPYRPSGEVRSIKHLHPAMVKPIYEANKGTAVADVIAGLIFLLAINQNREQFLVADANERRTEAERKLAEAVGLLRDWMGTWFVDADSRGENAIADDTRKFLSKEAERG